MERKEVIKMARGERKFRLTSESLPKKNQEEIQHIFRLIEMEAKIRGEKSEEAVDKTLDLMVAQKEIKTWFYDERQDKKRGRDRIIITKGGKVPIQIKSSISGARKHQRLARMFGGRYTHLVIVEPGGSLEDIHQKIKKVIQRSLKKE
jgi:hypothetical protein